MKEDPPFSVDCFTFSIDLGQEKGLKTLKRLIINLFSLCGMTCDFSQNVWKEIENRAYISSRKMNTYEFIQIMQTVNPKIEVLGEYHSVSEPIRCRCKECGYEWEPRASDLLYNGSGCRKCAGKMKPSQEEFINRLAKINPTIEVVGAYINSQTPLDVKCKTCGREWSVKPNNLIQGMRCRNCSSHRLSSLSRKTNEQFLLDLKDKGNPNVEVLGAYTGSHKKISCRCKVCRYEWEADPSSLLQGHGCKKCADEKKRGKRKPRTSKT